jgi:hypothetical protein
VAKKIQEGREGKYRAGIRENGFQGVSRYVVHHGRFKAAPRISRYCRELRIREDGPASCHAQAWASV